MTLKVFQIVGYKNSGKTTAICHLIDVLRSTGYKVATLKHHAHVETDQQDDVSTDTGKHQKSGALSTILAGAESAQMYYSKEPPLEAFVAFYKEMDVDVLLIEGYKSAPYPKAVMIRSKEDFQTLKDLKNIQAVIYSKEVPFSSTLFPTFSREDVGAYTSYIKKWLEEEA